MDTRVREEEEQGGAEWAWSFVQDTPHVWSHAPGVRFFLTQHRTAPAVIGQRDDPRLAETPAPASSAGGWGGGTWERARGACAWGGGGGFALTYFLATAKPRRVRHLVARSRCAETWQLLGLEC